jgi:hypothetical protein
VEILDNHGFVQYWLILIFFFLYVSVVKVKPKEINFLVFGKRLHEEDMAGRVKPKFFWGGRGVSEEQLKN